MAQTRKKRRRKHRGTQGGKIDTGTRRKARPRTREEARARARSKRGSGSGTTRLDRPPTWRSASIRGLIAAAVFFVLLLFAFKRPVGVAVAFAIFMVAFYIPAGYYIDQMMWRRRERAKMREEGG